MIDPRSLSTPDARRAQAALLRRLRDTRPLALAELRPPRANLSHARSIDTWIDMHHGIRRLARDTFVLLTDNAVGQAEEENLHHMQVNLAQDVAPSRLVPFLTCKHSLDYCLMFADRAASNGYEALIVLGGDREAGQPRCVSHAYELRAHIRERVPSLALGGWANPHRDPAVQAGYVADPHFAADFALTQVVSHHDLPKVERFLEEVRRRDIQVPLAFGVFYYRSAKAKTLDILSEFIPVPRAGLVREFEAGLSAEAICAKSIRALRDLGVDKVYISNVQFRKAARTIPRILELVEA